MPRIYAKVSIEMWGDRRFRDLSPLRPSGQGLWLYLLTGRFRTSIPGLNLNIGIGALSDRLGWSVAAVEKCWQEIESFKMAQADWDAGIVWLPKGIEHNVPESPNVIRGWGKQVLPECALMSSALQTLRAYLVAHKKGPFVEAFDETFGQGSRQVSANQEQEQEQEDQHPPTPAKAGAMPSVKPPTREERKWAVEYRRENARRAGRAGGRESGCPHDPDCLYEIVCIGRIVEDRRAAEAMGQRLSMGAS